jgi:hypothetical protein
MPSFGMHGRILSKSDAARSTPVARRAGARRDDRHHREVAELLG